VRRAGRARRLETRLEVDGGRLEVAELNVRQADHAVEVRALHRLVRSAHDLLGEGDGRAWCVRAHEPLDLPALGVDDDRLGTDASEERDRLCQQCAAGLEITGSRRDPTEVGSGEADPDGVPGEPPDVESRLELRSCGGEVTLVAQD